MAFHTSQPNANKREQSIFLINLAQLNFFLKLPMWKFVFDQLLRAAVRKYSLAVCKMKKSKKPKLYQNIGLGKLFLEK